ncbi:Hypothetical predicted protein [Argonauta hians]
MTTRRCCEKFGTAVSVVKAITSRSLFTSHGLLCIWRLTVVKNNLLYWCMSGSILLIVFETGFTLKKKRGGEWKWFSPSVFLYLAYSLPPIWLLELDLLNQRIHHRFSDQSNTTSEVQNLSLLTPNFKISIILDPEKWVRILQQVLLLLLIIGRWLLPKGKISREQLSQLLLVYIGMAADIIELFEAFKEEVVKYNWTLTVVILSLWTASLLQFTFVVTTSKARRPRPVYVKECEGKSEGSSENKTQTVKSSSSSCCCCCCCCCCSADILSILTTIVLQDGPFLVLRMLLIFRYNVLSYTNIFFTSKNSLVILLQLYRLLVLYCEKGSMCKNVAKNNPNTDGSKLENGTSKTPKNNNGKKSLNSKSNNKNKKDVNVENKCKKMKSLESEVVTKPEKHKRHKTKNIKPNVGSGPSQGSGENKKELSLKKQEDSDNFRLVISETKAAPLHSVSEFLLSEYNRSLHDIDSVKEDLPQVLELSKLVDNLPGPVLWSSDDEIPFSPKPFYHRDITANDKPFHGVRLSPQHRFNNIKRTKDNSTDASSQWTTPFKHGGRETADPGTVEEAVGVIENRKLIFPKYDKKTRK